MSTLIEREGTITFGDACLNIYEEGISAARAQGGYAGEKAWERKFKREVFARIVQTLNRLGWTCAMPAIKPRDVKHYGGDVARWSAESKRDCAKGDLKAHLDISGRCIKLEMWQNVTPSENRNGGQYDFNKEGRMPYVLRLEMERTRRRIRDYLCNVFAAYTFKTQEKKLGAHPGGAEATEWVEQQYRDSWHFKGDWSGYIEKNPSMQHNRGSADGRQLEHMQTVWFADWQGRICRGTAMYNINNMWWVVVGRYEVRNLASFELYAAAPDNLRVRRNADRRRKRLEAELACAVKVMKFERAAQLRDILFPGDQQLFNVWHDEHQLYHRAGFSGYTADQSQAGKFTADEVRGWDRAPNKVIAIAALREAA
jgi:hypothetical protein